MVLWGPQLLLHRLIALQAVAEWLGGLHSRPGYQGGIAFFWFRLSLELQAVTASHAPDGAASTEASKSSDAHDDDSAVTSDPVNELRSQSEQLAFGVTLLPSPDDEGSRSARALRLKDQLENLGVQRRKTLANLRNRRLRWSGESSYIRYRMKKDPAAFESPEAVALLKAKYRSAADKKRQAISALEQSVSDMKIEEARLRSRLAECRTGSGCAPGEPRAQGLPGPSAATGQSHAESERRERHSKRSWSHLLSARKAMAPADSGGVGSGPLLGLEERMELLRAQKRKTQNSLRCLRHQWSTEETYIKHRISAAKRQLAKRGGAPAFPSSETLESYRQTYRTRVVTRRQEMGVLEKLIHEMEIEEEQLRSRLLKCRSKAGEAPTEPSTEGHAGASTSTSQSQGLTVTGRSDIESGSAETESADLPEEASPVPGCSWWSIISPAELLGPTPKSAESSPPAEDRVKMLESELRLLRARRSNLISMRHNLRYKWKNEASYLHTKLLMLKYRRKAKNMATVGLSPELHQRLSQQYRERAPQHLARVEEMSRQIMALEEEAKEVAVQLLHARRLSDPAVETQTQASTVSSATEPAETSEVAGHHSPRDTIHARRDLVKSHSEPALEKPLDEAVASPFVAQIPSRSPTPVTTTEGASRESAALASTTHSMASGDLTTSSDWFTHAERTSESPSPLILHHQTAPLFAAGAPEAVVYGGPCTSGDSGGPPYSLSQIFEHAGAAHTTGYPRTESDIPEDVVEFVLSHSAPAVMASEDGAALFAESAPSFNQPWSSEYPPPRIVSPSEQAATSASLFQPTTSASDEGATLFAVPASSSAFSGPGWSSPQLQPSWYFPGALGHYAPVFGEPLPPEPRQPLLQSPARAPPADVIPPHAAQPSTAFVDVPSMFQQSQLRSPQLLSMRVRPSDSTSTTPPSLTSPSRRITGPDPQ